MKVYANMSYRKSYPINPRTNYVGSKQKRQLASIYYCLRLAEGIEIINVDESSIQETNKQYKGWGNKHQKLFNLDSKRLESVNIIAAISSKGRLWY